VFRLSTNADPAFLAEMLYEAVNWRPTGADERPPFDEVLALPQNARYITGWGRPGDAALCALDGRDEPVGAVWLRRFSASAPGYGYVADDVPELSMAVYPEFRRRHVGTLLLGAMVARAERDAVPGISLSVDPDNPARRLYARFGFEVVGESGTSLTLLLRLG
jgi:ribosomal protein S18 acetylase RimI-like enzyme